VTEFAERFFKGIQSCDRKGVTMPRRYLEKDILPYIGSKPVRNIIAEDVRGVSRSLPSPSMTCGAPHRRCCTNRAGLRTW
jgi:hypothetical protein